MAHIFEEFVFGGDLKRVRERDCDLSSARSSLDFVQNFVIIHWPYGLAF